MTTYLTDAEIRSLLAVEGGEVVRVYRAGGNILRGPKGVSAAVLWRLDAKGLIADGNSVWGALERTCRQIVTPAGKTALTQTKGERQ